MCVCGIESSVVCAGEDRMKNGIICGIAMSEKKMDNGAVRGSAAYPIRRELIMNHFCSRDMHTISIAILDLPMRVGPWDAVVRLPWL